MRLVPGISCIILLVCCNAFCKGTSHRRLRRKTQHFQPDVHDDITIRVLKSKSTKSQLKSSKSPKYSKCSSLKSKSYQSKGKGSKSYNNCVTLSTVAPTPAPSATLSPSTYDCASNVGRVRDINSVVQMASGSLSFSESSPQGLAFSWLLNVDTSNACDSITTISVSSFLQ